MKNSRKYLFFAGFVSFFLFIGSYGLLHQLRLSESKVVKDRKQIFVSIFQYYCTDRELPSEDVIFKRYGSGIDGRVFDYYEFELTGNYMLFVHKGVDSEYDLDYGSADNGTLNVLGGMLTDDSVVVVSQDCSEFYHFYTDKSYYW